MLDPNTSEDEELNRLFRELVQTLIRQMDTEDVDILTRIELRGQTLTELATQDGCSRTEASRRLNHAQRCLCRHLVMTLASLQSK